MKFSLLFIFFFVFSISLSAQNRLTFFDKNWNPTTGSNPSYKQILKEKDGSYESTIYKLPENHLYLIRTYANKDLTIYEGYYASYNENGIITTTGYYSQDKKSGNWKYYYKNGKLKYETKFLDETEIYLGYWNENGEQILENGTGTNSHIDDTRGMLITTEIKDSILYCQYVLNEVKSDTIYYVTDTRADYSKGGLDGFYKLLSENVKYPESARRMRQQGRVFVEFIIATDGTLENINVSKGVSQTLDQEALKAVLLTDGDWIAAKHEEKYVKSMLTVPVVFSLN